VDATALAATAQNAQLVLYDRLWHAGNYGASASVTLSSPAALTRAEPVTGTLGEGCELWLECSTVHTSTATTVSVSYTNSAGTAGRTATHAAPSSLASIAARQMVKFTLQAGDTGIRQVDSVTITNTQTGRFNLVILRRLAELVLWGNGFAAGLDPLAAGLPQLYGTSCLALMLISAGSATVAPQCVVTVIEG
jgi:hypothetical protein